MGFNKAPAQPKPEPPPTPQKEKKNRGGFFGAGTAGSSYGLSGGGDRSRFLGG